MRDEWEEGNGCDGWMDGMDRWSDWIDRRKDMDGRKDRRKWKDGWKEMDLMYGLMDGSEDGWDGWMGCRM